MTDQTAAPPVSPIHADLQRATAATERLAAAGIAVMAAMFNGRRPLLFVDRMPEGVWASLKRRTPNHFGGFTEIHAAEFEGCQIETMRDVVGPPPAQRVTLQVVANG